jgi:hypothetical protein
MPPTYNNDVKPGRELSAKNRGQLRAEGLEKMVLAGGDVKIIRLHEGYSPKNDPDCGLYVPLPEYGFALVQKKKHE